MCWTSSQLFYLCHSPAPHGGHLSTLPEPTPLARLIRPHPRSQPHATPSPSLCVAIVLHTMRCPLARSQVKADSFIYALMARGDVGGYKQYIAIGLPSDCLFRPRDQCSSGYPYSSASIPLLVRVNYRRRNGVDATSPMHRTSLSSTAFPLPLPFPSRFGSDTASTEPSSVRKCLLSRQVTEPMRGTLRHVPLLRVRVRGPVLLRDDPSAMRPVATGSQ
jgi:hypothetical protein